MIELNNNMHSKLNSPKNLVKVSIFLKEQTSEYSYESLWAEPVSDQKYKLKNIPFFAYGFSFNDIVSVKKVDQRLVVNAIISRSGHSTYRIFLSENTNFETFLEYWSDFKRLNCTFEKATKHLIAIDVPALTDIYKVYDVLVLGEKNGIWEFEEVHVGHKLK